MRWGRCVALVCLGLTFRTVALSAACAAPAGPLGTVHVLAVGVEDYSHVPLNNLNYAVDDAQAMEELFRTRFGYETELLIEREASAESVVKAIANLQQRVAPDDAVIFYFAGHGTDRQRATPDGLYQGFLIPWVKEDLSALTFADVPARFLEAAPLTLPQRPRTAEGESASSAEEEYKKRAELIRLTWQNERLEEYRREVMLEHALPMQLLKEKLQRMPCRHVVIMIDACYSGLTASRGSGADVKARWAAEASARLIKRFFDIREPSCSILTAGTGGQIALEHQAGGRGGYEHLKDLEPPPSSPIQHGVFTYEVLCVLKSIDAEGLSVAELHDQLGFRVAEVANYYVGMDPKSSTRMTPQMREVGGDGAFVFIPKPTDTWLRLALDAIRKRAAEKYSGSVTGRDESIEAASELIWEEYRGNARVSAAQQKLASLSLVTLAFRASLNLSPGSSTLSKDTMWVRRYQEASARAAAGDPDAMAALFYMYAYGLGVEPNQLEAGRWAGEAAGSQSSDARLAYQHALHQGCGVTLPEADREEMVKATESQREQQQLKFAAAAAMLAVTQASGNNAAKAGGILFALVVAAEETRSWLRAAPEKSLQASIAEFLPELDSLAGEMRKWRDRRPVDKSSLDNVRARVNLLNRRIVDEARRGLSHNPDRTVLKLVQQSSNDALSALSELSRCWAKPQDSAIRDGFDRFDRFERSVAAMIALLPYVNHQKVWGSTEDVKE